MKFFIPILLGVVLVAFQSCADDVPSGTQGVNQSSSSASTGSPSPGPSPTTPTPSPTPAPSPAPSPTPGVQTIATLTINKFVYSGDGQTYYSTAANVDGLQPSSGSFKIFQSPPSGDALPIYRCFYPKGFGYFSAQNACDSPLTNGGIVGYLSLQEFANAKSIYGPAAGGHRAGISDSTTEINNRGVGATFVGYGPN